MLRSIVAVLSFLAAHWDDVLTVVAGVVAIATVIVKITPTQTDDRWLATMLRWVEPLSLNKRAPAVVATNVPPSAVEGLVDKIAAGDPDALRALADELDVAAGKPKAK